MVKGYYKCECGKEFDNPQKFNGHKSQCTTHLILFGKIESRDEKSKKFINGGLKANCDRKEKAAKLKQENIDKWISEKHACEKCGKIMTKKFGTGRFCSVSCSHSRQFPQVLRDKISNKLKKIPVQPSKKKIKQMIINGQKLAEEINLHKSPYSEYNTAFLRKQTEGRLAYEFCLYDENKLIASEIVLVYRYIMACKYGRKLRSDEVVHHIDGNKLNNSVDNLEWCTYGHNLRHSYENGLFDKSKISGENNHAHRLTKTQIEEIRTLYKPRSKDANSYTLGRKYGVSHTHILDIIKSNVWK